MTVNLEFFFPYWDVVSLDPRLTYVSGNGHTKDKHISFFTLCSLQLCCEVTQIKYIMCAMNFRTSQQHVCKISISRKKHRSFNVLNFMMEKSAMMQAFNSHKMIFPVFCKVSFRNLHKHFIKAVLSENLRKWSNIARGYVDHNLSQLLLVNCSFCHVFLFLMPPLDQIYKEFHRIFL